MVISGGVCDWQRGWWEDDDKRVSVWKRPEELTAGSQRHNVTADKSTQMSLRPLRMSTQRKTDRGRKRRETDGERGDATIRWWSDGRWKQQTEVQKGQMRHIYKENIKQSERNEETKEEKRLRPEHFRFYIENWQYFCKDFTDDRLSKTHFY